ARPLRGPARHGDVRRRRRRDAYRHAAVLHRRPRRPAHGHAALGGAGTGPPRAAPRRRGVGPAQRVVGTAGGQRRRGAALDGAGRGPPGRARGRGGGGPGGRAGGMGGGRRGAGAPRAEPGGTSAALVDTATWDPAEGDSVSFVVDSLTVALWADTLDAARGAL